MTQHTQSLANACSLVLAELTEYWYEQVCLPIRVSATDQNATAAENHRISTNV
jgi:hypothetical protein